MKLLIATPAHDSKVHVEYLNSLIPTLAGLNGDGIDCKILTLCNESFIIRARDKCITYAIEQKFDKMIFIDSDLGWSYQDVDRLLKSDKKVIGGIYPLKTDAVPPNFNCLPEHMKYFSTEKTLAQFNKYKEEQANEVGEVEVKHVATGFLLIDMSIFGVLKDKVKHYYEKSLFSEEYTLYGNYFNTEVVDAILESEDWAFSRLCRENGFPVYINTNVLLSHTGTKKYVIC